MVNFKNTRNCQKKEPRDHMKSIMLYFTNGNYIKLKNEYIGTTQILWENEECTSITCEIQKVSFEQIWTNLFTKKSKCHLPRFYSQASLVTVPSVLIDWNTPAFIILASWKSWSYLLKIKPKKGTLIITVKKLSK